MNKNDEYFLKQFRESLNIIEKNINRAGLMTGVDALNLISICREVIEYFDNDHDENQKW